MWGRTTESASSSVHLLRSLSIGMLECGNAMASQNPLALGTGLCVFFLFSSWYGAQYIRESDCLASDRLLYPFRCKIPPEDLSLGLQDCEHVGPTAGGRSLRDETWNTGGRQGERCTPCGQRSDQIMMAPVIYRTICRTTVEPRVYVERRLLAAVRTLSRGRKNDYFASQATACLLMTLLQMSWAALQCLGQLFFFILSLFD